MAEPFLSEIRVFSFDFPPKNWAFCNGQLLPINQNQALFSLLGTTYGGDGRTTFALPNLQGRAQIHEGLRYTLGESAGGTSVTLNQQQMPTHTHALNATNADGTSGTASGNVYGKTLSSAYAQPADLARMSPDTVTNTGGSQPHNNMMPYLVLNFCIALRGTIPSPN